jgi:hypothetical protein
MTGNLWLDLALTIAAAVAGWLTRHYAPPGGTPPKNNP